MPTWTQDQLNAMGAVLAGTHDMLDPTPRVQPGYTLDQIYGGILPAAPAPVATANAPRQPSLTPAQLAAIRDVPVGSYQYPAVQLPNEPRGYSNPNTGNYGRASGMMLQPLDINYPANPPAPPALPSVPLPRPRPNVPNTSMEDALIQAGIKPGIPMAQQVAGPAPKPATPADPGWLKTSRQLAEVGFRQAAIQAANKKAPPPLPGVPALPPVPAGRRPSAPIPQPARGQSVAQFIQQQYGASPSVAYDKANEASAISARMRQTAMQQAGMMSPAQYLRFSGMSPSAAYDQANRNAQIAAIQRAQAAQASGAKTPVQQLQSQGMSSANAYAAANAQAAARARAAASNPSYQSSGGSGDWFSSVTR